MTRRVSAPEPSSATINSNCRNVCAAYPQSTFSNALGELYVLMITAVFMLKSHPNTQRGRHGSLISASLARELACGRREEMVDERERTKTSRHCYRHYRPETLTNNSPKR